MNKKIGNIFKGDKVIWMIFFFLCMISIVEVFSASSNLTYKSQNYIGPIVYHTGTIIFGVVVAIVTLNIPCRFFKLMTPFMLLITAITLLWVLGFHLSAVRDSQGNHCVGYCSDSQCYAKRERGR